jgi:hypothetical protein
MRIKTLLLYPVENLTGSVALARKSATDHLNWR